MSQPTSLRDPKRNCTEPPFHEKARDAPGRGRAVALAFAREGADVAIAYLNEHEDSNETKRIVEEAGRGALLIAADFADLKACARLFDETVKAFGRIDILANNAAFQGKVTESVAEIDEERIERSFRVDIMAMRPRRAPL